MIYFFGGLFLGLLIGILLIYFMLEIRNKCFIKNNSKKVKNEIIKTLIRQASRWSLAAENDTYPMVAVLHSNYGAGYLWACNDIASSSEITDATGINYLELSKKIIDVQDKSIKKMIKICPEFVPSNNILFDNSN